MTADVNPIGEGATLRQAQTALTEERILAAATELFLADGYVATTLEAVARRARVAARTVYVRFGTKAALFKRVVDVAVVGDTEPVDVLGRDWMIEAMTAPTLAGRIAAGAAVSRQIMGRTGALFAVAQQAAAVEPLIAAAWQEGREQTRHAQEVFCTKLADDGLLPPGADLTWLIDTTTVLVAAETYLLVTRMLGWDLDSYEAWVAATLTRLLTGPGDIPALPDPELVDERSPDRVVLVVAHPAGQEVELIRGDGGNPDGQVGELAVEPGPLGGRGGRVGGLLGGGPGDLPVHAGVAECAGVGRGDTVAGDEVGAGQLADEIVGGRVIGAPAAVDDLGVIAGVVGVGEEGALREQAQRGPVAELAERLDQVFGFVDAALGRVQDVPDGDLHAGGARGGDEPAGPRQVWCAPATVDGGLPGVGAVALVADQAGRQDLAGRLGRERAAPAVDHAPAVQGQVDGLAHAQVVERRGVDVKVQESGEQLRVDPELAAVVLEVGGTGRDLADAGQEVALAVGDRARASAPAEVEADQDLVRMAAG